MMSSVALAHIASAVVLVAIVALLLALLVKAKRAHAADVKRLETEVDALRHQNKAWQSAARDS